MLHGHLKQDQIYKTLRLWRFWFQFLVSKLNYTSCFNLFSLVSNEHTCTKQLDLSLTCVITWFNQSSSKIPNEMNPLRHKGILKRASKLHVCDSIVMNHVPYSFFYMAVMKSHWTVDNYFKQISSAQKQKTETSTSMPNVPPANLRDSCLSLLNDRWATGSHPGKHQTVYQIVLEPGQSGRACMQTTFRVKCSSSIYFESILGILGEL